MTIRNRTQTPFIESNKKNMGLLILVCILAFGLIASIALPIASNVFASNSNSVPTPQVQSIDNTWVTINGVQTLCLSCKVVAPSPLSTPQAVIPQK